MSPNACFVETSCQSRRGGAGCTPAVRPGSGCSGRRRPRLFPGADRELLGPPPAASRTGLARFLPEIILKLLLSFRKLEFIFILHYLTDEIYICIFVLILPKKRSFEQKDTKVTFAPAASGGGWSLGGWPALLLSPVTPLRPGGL